MGDLIWLVISFFLNLEAGGLAGTAVDTLLFPLDTLKTRLQSPRGFMRSGGFKGIYKGLSSAIVGSAPSASFFFVAYERLKSGLGKEFKSLSLPQIHMLAASGGELCACLVRVPTEIIKQRMQAGIYASVPSAMSTIWSSQGISGFYRGFTMTVFREVSHNQLIVTRFHLRAFNFLFTNF